MELKKAFRIEIEGAVRGRGPLILNEGYQKKIVMHPDFSSPEMRYDLKTSRVHNDIGLILSESLYCFKI